MLVHVTTHPSTLANKIFHIQRNGVETASFESQLRRVAAVRPLDWNSGHHDLSLGTGSPAESSAIFPIFSTPGSPKSPEE